MTNNFVYSQGSRYIYRPDLGEISSFIAPGIGVIYLKKQSLIEEIFLGSRIRYWNQVHLRPFQDKFGIVLEVFSTRDLSEGVCLQFFLLTDDGKIVLLLRSVAYAY